MLGLFIFGIIVALVAAVVIGATVVLADNPTQRLGGLAAGVVIGLLAALIMFGSAFRTVPPRSVGIQVTFGKVTSMLGAGPHLVKPWSKVVNFPNTIQTTKLAGNAGGKDEEGPCVTVRLGNQTTACVDVTTQWQINTQDAKGVEALYAHWRTFGHIDGNLIRPQLQHALLAPFETYDPLASLSSNTQLTVPTADLEGQTRKQFQEAVGSGITITQLTINLIKYDQTTQDKINAYSQAVADTRIAEQRKLTADAQRQANDALASSQSSKDPGVLTQNCLDVTERMTKEGKALPGAWTCLGGGATPVVSVG